MSSEDHMRGELHSTISTLSLQYLTYISKFRLDQQTKTSNNEFQCPSSLWLLPILYLIVAHLSTPFHPSPLHSVSPCQNSQRIPSWPSEARWWDSRPRWNPINRPRPCNALADDVCSGCFSPRVTSEWLGKYAPSRSRARAQQSSVSYPKTQHSAGDFTHAIDRMKMYGDFRYSTERWRCRGFKIGQVSQVVSQDTLKVTLLQEHGTVS